MTTIQIIRAVIAIPLLWVVSLIIGITVLVGGDFARRSLTDAIRKIDIKN